MLLALCALNAGTFETVPMRSGQYGIDAVTP